ncbi:MAG: hypothetical protein ACI82S_001920, partial [Patiriisocius sp.]
KRLIKPQALALSTRLVTINAPPMSAIARP